MQKRALAEGHIWKEVVFVILLLANKYILSNYNVQGTGPGSGATET